MSDNTKISWSDASWNPVSGCTEVSPGCANCYAKTFAERFRGVKGSYYENGFDVQLRPNMLERPLHWTRPRRIFVNSMSDLFHEEVDLAYIVSCFQIMDLAKQHTFQILTKRIERALAVIQAIEVLREQPGYHLRNWPLPNVLIGPTVENQHFADVRLPVLAQIKALGWRTMVSYEPALQAVDFTPWLGQAPASNHSWLPCLCGEIDPADRPSNTSVISWLICGGESGAGRRPFNHDWARSALAQCRAAGVPFFFKQMGALRSESLEGAPNDLLVREFPS